MTIQVMKGAEPWGHQGDGVGVLVIHGFTGSPQSVRYWAEGIAAQGRTVSVPRLPGHGTTPDDMQRTTARDWVGEAEMHLAGLHERCDAVFVCGLSMGGTIALDLAERFGDRIAGVVTVNAPVLASDPRERLAPFLGKVPLKLKGVANDIADPSQRELAYPVVPTKAAASFIAFRERVRARLGDILCPALIFKSRTEKVVKAENGPYVLDAIASTDKELVWLEKSYHVATLDYDRDLIVERTNDFIKRRSE